MQYRIGIDLGGTAIKAGVVDENHRIVCQHTRPTGKWFSAIVADIAAAAETVAGQAGIRVEDCPCVGVGTPGCIHVNTGRLAFSGNLSLRDVPLREELAKRLPVPVYIGNDANCAIAGETVAGAAKGCRNVVMLTLGTGVGGGVILDGKLLIGGDGMGAELGHTPLVAGGYPCTCGINGCLEAYASVTALIRQAQAAMAAHPESALHAAAAKEGAVTGKLVTDCARAGDETALAVLDRYTDYVAGGIGGFINIFRPEVVLIGGGLSGAGDFLLDPIREKTPRYVFAGDIIGVPPIRKAALGNAAGTIGAAYLDQM